MRVPRSRRAMSRLRSRTSRTAIELEDPPLAHVLLGAIAYMDDRFPDAREEWERAFAGLRRAGELRAAARVAIDLAELHVDDREHGGGQRLGGAGPPAARSGRAVRRSGATSSSRSWRANARTSTISCAAPNARWRSRRSSTTSRWRCWRSPTAASRSSRRAACRRGSTGSTPRSPRSQPERCTT